MYHRLKVVRLTLGPDGEYASSACILLYINMIDVTKCSSMASEVSTDESFCDKVVPDQISATNGF